MIVAYRTQSRAVFLYGLPRTNGRTLKPTNCLPLGTLRADLLAVDSARIAEAIENGVLQEIELDEEKET
jgi:hypothetical protein